MALSGPRLDELGPGDVVSGDQNYSWHSDPVITDQEPPARLIDSSRYGHPSRALLAAPRTVSPTPGENHQSCTFPHDINNPARLEAAGDGSRILRGVGFSKLDLYVPIEARQQWGRWSFRR